MTTPEKGPEPTPPEQPAGVEDRLESLGELIARLEGDPRPRDEYHFDGPFRALRRSTQERGGSPSPELEAEELAFSFHPLGEQGGWGLHFGPMMTGTTASGEPWEIPALSAVTPEVLAYWRRRAEECRHPVLRARYADLLWELPKSKQVTAGKPDPDMARVAVDAYLDAIQGRRYEHAITNVENGRRALEIALSVRDGARVERARDVLLAFEEAEAEDGSLGLWGVCFDTFVEPPNKNVPLTDAGRQRLVDDLESRLARFAAAGPSEYHPSGPEAAALRLANYYRRCGAKADVARVLRVYADIVRQMQGAAAPMVVGHSMERLYHQLKTFELHEDADALNEAIRVAGEESLRDMKYVTVKGPTIPREQLEAYFSEMLSGGADEVLGRIAIHFVPRRDQVEDQLREMAKKAPLSFMVTHTIVNDEGRTIARVGPLDSDLEGNVVRHVAQNLQLSIPWLREAMARGFERGLLTASIVLDTLVADGTLFQAKRRPMLKAGLEAYARDDSMAAVHILVPQVEEAIRQLAMSIGATIYTQRRGGGFHARTLDDLLRDEEVGAALRHAFGESFGTSVITYLRTLLSDQRGWNIRNDVCHGLAPEATLSLPVADRIVHALLVLSLLRAKPEAPEAEE